MCGIFTFVTSTSWTRKLSSFVPLPMDATNKTAWVEEKKIPLSPLTSQELSNFTTLHLFFFFRSIWFPSLFSVQDSNRQCEAPKSNIFLCFCCVGHISAEIKPFQSTRKTLVSWRILEVQACVEEFRNQNLYLFCFRGHRWFFH